jgi:uncharacterized membrane protein YgcG
MCTGESVLAATLDAETSFFKIHPEVTTWLGPLVSTIGDALIPVLGTLPKECLSKLASIYKDTYELCIDLQKVFPNVKQALEIVNAGARKTEDQVALLLAAVVAAPGVGLRALSANSSLEDLRTKMQQLHMHLKLFLDQRAEEAATSASRRFDEVSQRPQGHYGEGAGGGKGGNGSGGKGGGGKGGKGGKGLDERCRDFARGSCSRGDFCIFKHE